MTLDNRWENSDINYHGDIELCNLHSKSLLESLGFTEADYKVILKALKTKFNLDGDRYDEVFMKALNSYKKENGLSENGIIEFNVLVKVIEENPPNSSFSKGIIKKIKEYKNKRNELKKKGFFDEKSLIESKTTSFKILYYISGVDTWGKDEEGNLIINEVEIKKYQKEHNLTETGIISSATYFELLAGHILEDLETKINDKETQEYILQIKNKANPISTNVTKLPIKVGKLCDDEKVIINEEFVSQFKKEPENHPYAPNEEETKQQFNKKNKHGTTFGGDLVKMFEGEIGVGDVFSRNKGALAVTAIFGFIFFGGKIPPFNKLPGASTWYGRIARLMGGSILGGGEVLGYGLAKAVNGGKYAVKAYSDHRNSEKVFSNFEDKYGNVKGDGLKKGVEKLTVNNKALLDKEDSNAIEQNKFYLLNQTLLSDSNFLNLKISELGNITGIDGLNLNKETIEKIRNIYKDGGDRDGDFRKYKTQLSKIFQKDDKIVGDFIYREIPEQNFSNMEFSKNKNLSNDIGNELNNIFQDKSIGYKSRQIAILFSDAIKKGKRLDEIDTKLLFLNSDQEKFFNEKKQKLNGFLKYEYYPKEFKEFKESKIKAIEDLKGIGERKDDFQTIIDNLEKIKSEFKLDTFRNEKGVIEDELEKYEINEDISDFEKSYNDKIIKILNNAYEKSIFELNLNGKVNILKFVFEKFDISVKIEDIDDIETVLTEQNIKIFRYAINNSNVENANKVIEVFRKIKINFKTKLIEESFSNKIDGISEGGNLEEIRDGLKELKQIKKQLEKYKKVLEKIQKVESSFGTEIDFDLIITKCETKISGLKKNIKKLEKLSVLNSATQSSSPFEEKGKEISQPGKKEGKENNFGGKVKVEPLGGEKSNSQVSSAQDEVSSSGADEQIDIKAEYYQKLLELKEKEDNILSDLIEAFERLEPTRENFKTLLDGLRGVSVDNEQILTKINEIEKLFNGKKGEKEEESKPVENTDDSDEVFGEESEFYDGYKDIYKIASNLGLKPKGVSNIETISELKKELERLKVEAGNLKVEAEDLKIKVGRGNLIKEIDKILN